MYLAGETNQPPHLVIENPGEVAFANEALVLARHNLTEAEPDLSSHHVGGERFPFKLSQNDTDRILIVMNWVTRANLAELGSAETALSKKPIDLKYVSIARLAIRGMLLQREQGERL